MTQQSTCQPEVTLLTLLTVICNIVRKGGVVLSVYTLMLALVMATAGTHTVQPRDQR